MERIVKRKIMNACTYDDKEVAVTLTTAHDFAGNILFPRQGYRQMGVLEIWKY